MVAYGSAHGFQVYCTSADGQVHEERWTNDEEVVRQTLEHLAKESMVTDAWVTIGSQNPRDMATEIRRLQLLMETMVTAQRDTVTGTVTVQLQLQ